MRMSPDQADRMFLVKRQLSTTVLLYRNGQFYISMGVSNQRTWTEVNHFHSLLYSTSQKVVSSTSSHVRYRVHLATYGSQTHTLIVKDTDRLSLAYYVIQSVCSY